MTDTIPLQKYSHEYYEYGPYLNDTTLRGTEDDVYQEAEDPEAFICWVYYGDGKLYQVKWYKEGTSKVEKDIPITKAVRELFSQCKNTKK